VEPLGDRWVDGCGGQVGGRRDGYVGRVIPVGIPRGAGVGYIADGNFARGGVTVDEAAPGLMGLVDDLHGVLLIFSLTGEGELILGLAVGDLVDPEPLVSCPDEPGQVTLDILDIIQLGSERVVDINDDDLPVGLALIEEGHDTENFDLLDLTSVTDLFADLANVEWIVVTLGLGFGVRVVWILPGLREGTIVPDVTVMGEAVSNETQTTLFYVLLDGIEGLILGDLDLCVGPTWDLNNHVEDTIVLVEKERDVVEGGKHRPVLFGVDAMFEGVGSTDDTGGILGDHGR